MTSKAKLLHPVLFALYIINKFKKLKGNTSLEIKIIFRSRCLPAS